MGETRLDGPTKIINGDFETATTSSWDISVSAGAVATIDVSTIDPFKNSFDMEIDITDVGSSTIFQIRTAQSSLSIVQSESYSIIFGVKATDARSIIVSMSNQNSPFGNIGLDSQIIQLINSWQSFEAFFIANSTTLAELNFFTGVDSINVHVDDISLRLAIDVDPLYDYTFEENIQREDVRTKEGGLITYIQPGTFNRFTLPLTWVTSRDRSFVNSWWRTGADLRFIENTDSPGSFFDVRITGGQEPFTTFVRPYYQQFYAGEIILETI